MAPRPVVSFETVASTDVYLGDSTTLTLRFDNIPTDPTEVGYAPYIDVILPRNGTDGSGTGNAPANDGLTFLQATHLGVAVESTLVEFDAAGLALHPFALDAAGNPLVVHGTPGDQLLVLKLPFGSFTGAQTPADILLTLGLSNLADLGQPLAVTATGGFAYGADEFNDPAADPVITGAPATLGVNPIVATLHVDYWGPEQETATGPSYPRTWVAWAQLATGQSFDNLTLIDTLPDGVVLTRTPQLIDGLTGAALPGTVQVVRNADGTQTVTGAFDGTILAGTVKPMLKLDWYVTEFLSNTALPPNTPVLDPATGAFRPLQDHARLTADWIPIDARDRADVGQPAGTPPSIRIDIDPVGPEDIVTAKSIAIQKGVALVSGDADLNGVKDWQPGGDLRYTLEGQVSNYFEMQDLVVDDTLGDGQTFDAAQAPTISIFEGGTLVYSGAVVYSAGVAGAGALAKTAAGRTPLVFDISATLRNAGLDPVLDGNGGGLGAVPHAAAYRPATISIAYHTTLDASWTGPVPGDGLVDQGDPIRNDVLYDGAVYLTGEVPRDDSGAHVTLPVSSVSKAIYAINGDTTKGTTGFDAPAQTQAGDLITFRLGLDLPLTSAHKVTLADFLPLPVLRAADADADAATPAGFSFLNIADATSPAAGVVKFGPADTFHDRLPGLLPTLRFDAAGNSLTLDFGDVTDPAYRRTTLDLLVTLRVNDKPFGDGLLLTNQVTSSETNSFGDVSARNAIIQFILGEPVLKLTKGVIGSDNPASGFVNATTLDGSLGPLAFTAPGSAGPRFAGTLGSDLLSTTPVDADLHNGDAGDTVSFAIVVENTGQGWRGAFDTLIRDILPTGYVATGLGAAGINLQVTDGSGRALAWQAVGAGLFDAAGGIELVDPASGNGALGSYDPTSGANIAVITYDLKLADTLALAAVPLRNTAAIAHYAAEEGGIDRVPSNPLPVSDDASIDNVPTITKLVATSSLGATGTAQGDAALADLAIGETVTYSITIRLPEGSATALQLQDLLPNAGGQLQAISATLTGIGANLSGGAQFVLGQAGLLSDRNADGVADTLSFDFGNVANAPDNVTDGGDLIAVQVVARLTDTAANRALDGQALTNTATLSFQAAGDPADRRSISATADVEAVKPHLTIAKGISQSTGDAADVVTYTITLTNEARGYDATAYDISIDDDLLADLGIDAAVLANSITFASGSAAATVVQGNAAGAAALQVTAAALDAGQFIRFSFKAKISDTVPAGTTITNTATATASTLPGTDPQEHAYSLADDAVFKVNPPSVAKLVFATGYADTATAQGSSASDADVKVNEEITYRITVTLPEGISQNFRIVDSLADSLALGTGGGLLSYVAGSAKVVSIGGNLSGGALLAAPTITATDSGAANGFVDRISFDFGTIDNDPNLNLAGGDDIVVELKAVAASHAANQAGDRLTNSAYAETDLARSTTATATVDFVEPRLTVDKAVDIAVGNAGDIATYTVTIRHAAGSGANAYDVDLTDLLPAGEAYVAGSLSTLAGLSISGGTIAFHQDAFALGSGPISFSYQARLLDDVVNGQAITNTAVLDWQTAGAAQAPNPGRTFSASDPATVSVALGNAIGKAVDTGTSLYTTGSNAAAGETFTYTITATLAEGTQHLVLTDLLPAGLTFISASLVSIGSNITGATPAGGTWNAATRKVGFDFGDVTNAGDNLSDARDQITVQVVAQVPIGASAGTTLTNTASLSSTVPVNAYGVAAGTAQPDLTDARSLTTVAAAIGNLVFVDKNGNGIQDSGETGVNGFTVRLLDPGTDAVLATTTTARVGGTDGSYSFTSLVPGQYKLQFLPAGATASYLFSAADAGADDTRDSDANPASGKTGVYTLTNGTTDTSVDAGVYLPITIGDTVFEDVNGNRLQDAGDRPLAGVTVQLLDAANVAIAGRSVVTLADGSYSFSGLAPGKYAVQFTRPAGSAYVITGTTSGAAATDSDPNAGTGITAGKTYASGASDSTIDAGFYLPAALGDRVWLDTNGNGLQDAGEAGLDGVTIKLFSFGTTTQVGATQTTSGGGAYGFTGLRPGDYYATVTAPAGYLLTKATSGAAATDSDPVTTGGVVSASTGKITLTSGQTDLAIDAGAWRPVTIGDRVFEDANLNGRDDGEPGIAGVAVSLLDASGAVVTTTTTGATGAYGFSVAPGTYRVKVATPAGTIITTQDAAGVADTLDSDIDAGGLAPLRTYVSGDADGSIDAGFWRPASIGDRVWVDTDGDGVQDAGEAGLAGVTVNLLQGGSLVASQATGAGGTYRFALLPPGDYRVQVVAPAGYRLTLADRAGDALDSDADPATGRTGSYTLTAGQDVTSADIGLFQPVAIGDRAFEDLNGNGIDDAEPGVDGVTVTITNALTGESLSQVTHDGGQYLFTGLRPGTWQESVAAPAGWVLAPAGRGTAATDSDPDPATGQGAAFAIASGQNDLTHDVGLYRPVSLGDTVFLDRNGNGIQDAGDGVLAGVTVRLLGADGLPIAGQQATTDAAGHYGFAGLAPGRYGVQFDRPAGYVAASTGAGTASTDSDADPLTGRTALKTYASGAADADLDAGFYKLGWIGDRVWLDADGDGRQDAGESGIAGVAVRLLRADGSATGLTTTTAADGSYAFEALPPGDYRVGFTAPAGLSFTRPFRGAAATDSDADQVSGISGIHSLASGSFDDGIDAGLYRRVTIGDRVWEDVDGDGLQGSGEPGLDGITVTLTNDVTGDTATQVTVGGAYLFTDLPPGRYHVAFTAPPGWRFTQQVTGDAAADSDARPDGSTAGLDLTSGGSDLAQDAGLYRPGSLAGHVGLALPPAICDFKLPGAVFAGVTVRLLDSHGAQVAATTTDHAGGYVFADLAPARYTLEFVLPGGLVFTAGGTATQPVVLQSGEDLTGLDRVLAYRTGSLLDGTPLVVTGGAYDVKDVPRYIALPEGGVVNLNVAGNFIVAGVGNLNANGNVGGQYVIGGTGNNVLHSGPNGGSILVGGGGSNIFEGSADPDIMVGGCGPNNMQALGTSKAWLAGYDILLGGPSNDVLESNDSLALIYGGGGNEDIHGSGTLIGGTNDGTIHRDATTGELSGLRIGDLVKGGNQADTFIYQKGDGVQWIEAVHPGQGDTVQVYGYAAPTATGRLNGMEVLYFGEDAALVFNSPVQPGSIVYHPDEDAMPGAFGHIAPLPPVVLAPGANRFHGTEGDDIAVATTGTTFHGNGGNDVLIGSNAADVFDGGDGGNTMIGKNGADVFTSGRGNNAIDGGGGTDKVAYGFAATEASVVMNADGSWTVRHIQGGAVVKTDLLRDVETLAFADGDVTIAVGKAAVAPARDFDGDGNNDYLFRAADGSAAIWHMDGQAFIGGGTFANPGNAWQVAGTGDFDGDGRADILWRNGTDGSLSLWLMDGLVAKSTTALWNPGTGWTVNGIGDFNGDGRSDILWRQDDGTIATWLMDGATSLGGGSIAAVANDWRVAGTGDFNGDGKSDILWRHDSGAVSEWWMDGPGYVGGAAFGVIDTAWHIVGTGDFNGDTRSDILWRHDGGAVSLWLMDGSKYLGGGTLGNPGTAWKVAGLDDFNGDDRADILWRNDGGAISVWLMDGTAGVGGGFVANPGALWHLV
ncbi:SdrD B-like domain-containing protein [Dankookia sp. GCM10030260]|uniref:SdrD B-like domain-containing protein n=1 Tax=Dankookia sp. GCM10030260 TaxID=3273390 RepID=UPI00360D4DC0